MTEVASHAAPPPGAAAASATNTTRTTTSSSSSAPGSATSSPNPDESGAPAGAQFRPRKLSAAAKEWAPPSGDFGPAAAAAAAAAALHSPSLGPVGGSNGAGAGAAEEKDVHDAEDDDELAAVVDAALASKGSDPHLLAVALQRQVEFLLSNQSLWKHAPLQNEMSKDATGAGFVPLTFLLGLREVAALTHDVAALALALKYSEKLVLSDDGRSVRRLNPLPSFDGYRDSNRVIFVDRLPPGSTVRSVKKLFHRFGQVTYVLRADQMLGASGMHVQEKGQLTPHASPKIKPRSLSHSDISPSILMRRLAAGYRAEGSAGLASPQLGAVGTGSLVHLSPAARNRAIASSTQAVVADPDTFTSAFIQFAQPASAKKAVSHIVAYNKQLKAQTPKGSPRIMGAGAGARRSSLGPGGIPTASLGHSALDGTSTPPRARSSRISSNSTQNTPLHSPAHALSFAGPRMEGLTLGAQSSGHHEPLSLPPAAGVSHPHPHTSQAPARFAASPPPLHPLSPLEREKQQQRKRANSSAGVAGVGSTTSPPPFVPTTVFSSALSPTLAPVGSLGPVLPATPAAASAPFHDTHKTATTEGALPELSLGGTVTGTATAAAASDATSPANASTGLPSTCPATPVNGALVAALPEQFIGVFIMPKIAFLKSLKAKAAAAPPATADKQSGRPGAASPSPAGSTVVSPVNGAPAAAASAASTPVAATTTAATPTPREKQPSPPTPTLAPQKTKQQQQASHTVPASAPAPTRQLSAQAPVFNPSPVPLVVPAPVKAAAPAPLLQASTGSPQQSQRVLKSNWRSDGLPVVSDFTAMDDGATSAANAATGVASVSSPLLGPAAAPTFDEHGNVVTPSGQEKKKKQKQPKHTKTGSNAGAAGSSPAPEGGAGSGAQQSEGESSASSRPSKQLDVDRPKFTLTKRNSLGLAPENARQVVSRFALGPDAPDAVGFAGRGRGGLQRSSPATLPPAGGGKPL